MNMPLSLGLKPTDKFGNVAGDKTHGVAQNCNHGFHHLAVPPIKLDDLAALRSPAPNPTITPVKTLTDPLDLRDLLITLVSNGTITKAAFRKLDDELRHLTPQPKPHTGTR